MTAAERRGRLLDELDELLNTFDANLFVPEPEPEDANAIPGDDFYFERIQPFLSGVPQNVLADRAFILPAVNMYGRVFFHASDDLKNDREVVLGAVSNSGWMLYYASEELKNDRMIVLAAVKDEHGALVSGNALQYASDELKNDREIVLAAVYNDGSALEYASDVRKNDRWVVLAAVGNKGWALQYASVELRFNKRVVLAFVNSDGCSLQHASLDLQNDTEVVLAAVRNNGSALQYASVGLKHDRDIVLAAVSNPGEALRYASDELKNDRGVVLTAVNNDRGRGLLEYASDELKADREVVATAVSNPGQQWVLRYASNEMKNDPFVISRMILSEDGFYYHYVGGEFKNRLRLAITDLREHFGAAGPPAFFNANDVLLYVQQWNQILWETIDFMLTEARLRDRRHPDGRLLRGELLPEDTVLRILLFSGVQGELYLLHELEYFALVIGAFAEKGVAFADINLPEWNMWYAFPGPAEVD